MITWLAFHRSQHAPGEVERAITRVEAYLATTTDAELHRAARLGPSAGLVCWRSGDPPTPEAWAETTESFVATPYLLLGGTAPSGSLHERAAALFTDAGAHDRLPPVLVGIHGSRRTVLANDVLGIARAYEYQRDGLTIWSNRLCAIVAFAGARAGVDIDAWRSFAALGWFPRDRTPFDGIRRLDPGTVVTVSPSGIERQATDAVSAISAAPHRSVDEVAEALVSVCTEAAAVWKGRPRVSLSGGRDSRLVAAAALRAGVDPILSTNAAIPEEVEVAEALVARLPMTARHNVGGGAHSFPEGDLLARARALLELHDGIHAPGVLTRYTPSDRPPRASTLGGLGGELGHGFYYRAVFGGPPEPEDEPSPDAFARFLGHAAGGAGRREAERVVQAAFADARARGLRGPTLLDHFYLTERLRNWSAAGAHRGTLHPLLHPAFIEKCFQMPVRERNLSAPLHRALIERLMPEWADVPFLAPKPADRTVSVRPRLWESADVHDLRWVVERVDLWADCFEEAEVRRVFRDALAGRGTARHETLLLRVVMRAAFAEHVQRLNAAARGAPGDYARLESVPAGSPRKKHAPRAWIAALTRAVRRRGS